MYVVDEATAEQVTGFLVHRGALASLHRAELPPVEDLLGVDRLVVLEDVVDHTNVGAILRKLALRDRVQIVVYAHEHGLAPL